jgi:YkoY family integral membrane protein
MNFTSQDLLTVGMLVILEGLLSVDNALVLAILARELPKEQQRKALTYGVFGAIGFRILALFFITTLLKFAWIKFVGGAYLLFIAFKYFWIDRHIDDVDDAVNSTTKPIKVRSFWATVAVIELTDIAFAVDSLLAAIALSPKLWVIITGGILGILTMRFAAQQFIKLLDEFPGLERSSYLLVALIGFKVILEGLHIPGVDFHNPEELPFWIFWALMATALAIGFKRKA